MRVVVFDVDGVLVSSVERYDYAVRRAGCRECPRFWRFFLDPGLILELDAPRPLGVDLAKTRLSQGLALAVVTGRPETLRRTTLKQLRMLGLKPLRLLMRARGDVRSEHVVKREAVERLLYEGCEVVEIHDDNIESLASMGRVAREASLILHDDYGCIVYRRGSIEPPEPCRRL